MFLDGKDRPSAPGAIGAVARPWQNKGVPNVLSMISTAGLISPVRSSFGVATKAEGDICRSVDTGDFFDSHLRIGQHLPASRPLRLKGAALSVPVGAAAEIT